MCFWKCHLNVLGSERLAHAFYFEISVSQYLGLWDKNDVLASSQSLSNPKCNRFQLSRLDPKSATFKWNKKNKIASHDYGSLFIISQHFINEPKVCDKLVHLVFDFFFSTSYERRLNLRRFCLISNNRRLKLNSSCEMSMNVAASGLHPLHAVLQ